MKIISFLVVDDSSTIRNLVAKSLRTLFANLQVYEADNGREALKILNEEQVDIIISDWNMPVMDGEELLYEVRNDDRLCSLPFIMMTTNEDRDFIITAIQLGVTQYIVKPFTYNELEGKVRLSMNTFNKRQENRYALPDHTVSVNIDGKSISGKMLDVSRTGALISLKNDSCLGLYKTCELDLHLLDSNGLEQKTSILNSLFGVIVRLTADNILHPTTHECQMALYFNPAKMTQSVEDKLKKIIVWLSEKAPEVIGKD